LPDRFDEDGRPLYGNGRGGDRNRNTAKEFGGGNEMVERVVRGVGEVVEGKKTWGDLLMGLVKDGGFAGGADDEVDGKRRRERRKSRSRGRDRDY